MELKEIRKKERRTENERRKEQMIDVAFICFSEKGMEAASISDIAKEAAFGEATVYRYFSNKETLVLECGKKFWHMAADFFDAETNTEAFRKASGIQQVELMMRAACRFYENERAAFRLIHDLDVFLLSHQVQKEQLKEYEEAVDALRPYLCEAIEKGKEDGSIANKADTLELYYTITNGIFGLMQKQAAGSLLSTDLNVNEKRKIELFVELLIAGVRDFYGK